MCFFNVGPNRAHCQGAFKLAVFISPAAYCLPASCASLGPGYGTDAARQDKELLRCTLHSTGNTESMAYIRIVQQQLNTRANI